MSASPRTDIDFAPLRSLLECRTNSKSTLFASVIDEQRRSVRRLITSSGHRSSSISAEAGAGLHVIGRDRSEVHCVGPLTGGQRRLGASNSHDLEPAVVEALAAIAAGAGHELSARLEVITEQCQQRIVNLEGASVARETDSVRLHLRLQSRRHGSSFVAKRSLALRDLAAGGHGEVASSAEGLMDAARGAVRYFTDPRAVPRGMTDAVLGNGSSGIFLHEVLGHCLEGDVLLTGLSVFSGRIGERIATASWTVVDEPLTSFDDEGERAKTIVLVERGRLRAPLLDRRTALRFGLGRSHNGRLASFREPPLPRMNRTMLLAGGRAPEEIVRAVKRGVYIERLSAAAVVVGTGDFTLVVSEARLIENGRLTAPLPEFTVIGNGPKQLLGSSDLGTDPTVSSGVWTCVKGGQSIDVAFGGPTLRLRDVVVRGSA